MTDFDPTPRGIAKQQARAAATNAYRKWKHRQPDHEHQWTDADPALFTNNLVRCTVCGDTAPKPPLREHCRYCGNPDHTAPTCPQKATT